MARPKKSLMQEFEETIIDEVEEETLPVETPIFNELVELTNRRKNLLDLRNTMAAEGINDISNLDVRLSQLNQRIAELES
jgi:hypothetical protein